MIRNVTKGVTTPGRHRQVTSRSAAHRPATLVALVMAALLFTATAATAQWSSVGFGTGSAAAATLAAPTNVSATAAAGGSTVSLSWTPSAQSPSQVAPQGYYVTRMDGGTAAAACGTTVAALTTTASCTDLNVPNGTYSYLVTAVYRSWTATSIASNPVTVRAAAKLAFSAQPSATVAGTSISPAVAVTLQDAAGIPVAAAGFSVTVNIGSNPVGGTLSGTATAVTNAGGVASFGGLSIDKAGTGYTLTGNSSGLTAATSSAFAVSAAAASQVVFAQQPTSAVAGVGIAPAVTVRIVDQFGNLTASTAAVTVAIGTNPGVGTLSGTSTQSAVAGVATFAGLSINKAGTGYTLTAVSGSLTGATSSAFTISAGTVSKFAITSPAVSGQASSTATLGPITVQQQDALGNPVLATGGGTTVTLTSNSTGTKVFAATSGGSSVSSVTIPAGSSSASFYYGDTAAGGPTITVSGSLTSATQVETVTAAAASSVVFGQQPTSAVAGAGIAPAVTVRIVDQFGNLTASSAAVTVAIGTNPGGGTLSGTAIQSAAAGVATFSGLSINKAGTGYTLTAGSGSLTGATSSAFTISAGTASKFAITSAAVSGQASSTTTLGPITVQQQDAAGNPVTATGGGTTVTLASSSAGTKVFAATSGGSSVSSVIIPAGSSSASFFYGDTAAGGPTITASGSLASATQVETVTATAANAVVFGQQPTSAVAGAVIAPAVTVRIVDQFGNLTASTAAVTVAIGTNPAAGTLSGTVTLSAVAGVATFSGLSINKAGTGYTLTAASPGLTGATSSTITISPAPTKLTFTPSGSTGCSAQNGTLFALNYPGCGGNGATFHSSVNLTDTSGNPVVNNTGAAISVSVTASAGTLTGATGGILTVTIPVGSSTSGSVDFASQGGSWNSNTITAKSTGYTDATATFNK